MPDPHTVIHPKTYF